MLKRLICYGLRKLKKAIYKTRALVTGRSSRPKRRKGSPKQHRPWWSGILQVCESVVECMMMCLAQDYTRLKHRAL